MPTTNPSTLTPKPSVSAWLHNRDSGRDGVHTVSTYAYCANNPVVMKDPNGEDYEVVVDDEQRMITIRATFFTTKEDARTLKAGIKLWTDQASDQYTYTTETMEYSIVFDFIVKEYQSYSEASKAYPNDSRKSGSNLFAIDDKFLSNMISENETEARGACDGYNIALDSSASYRTAAHEIGHALGLADDAGSIDWLMTSGGKSKDIPFTYVIRMLHNVGLMTDISDNDVGIERKIDSQCHQHYNSYGKFEQKVK